MAGLGVVDGRWLAARARDRYRYMNWYFLGNKTDRVEKAGRVTA